MGITQKIIDEYKNLSNTSKAALISAMAVTTAVVAYNAIEGLDIGSQSVEEEISPQDISEGGINIVASEDSSVQCRATNLPSFINMSIGWPGSLVEEGVQNISPPAVLVVAAGNDYPTPVSEEIVQISKNLNAIVVGSMGPNGSRSSFSSEHEEVHIMAPSDHYLTTADGEGSYQRFSGTSGATPLVTGSLAAFEWLSGYHPTAAEAKFLLERTAIQTMELHEDPPKNGVGMVNAYKLGMVGKKLQEMCGTDVSCFKEKIQDSATYDFPENSEVLQLVARAFPECSVDNCSNNFDICTDKAEAIKELRKAAFLNPSNKELWRYLTCIYRSNGFIRDAAGALSFYKALFGLDRDNLPVYGFCNANTDCTLVPSSCSATESALSSATQAEADIYYVEGCQETRLCNNKCRCSGSENVALSTEGSFDYYTSRCVNSRCVSTKEAWSQPAGSPGSNQEQKTESEAVHTQDRPSGSR